MIEPFTSPFRRACLNEHWFLSLEDVQEKVDAWWKDCNRRRAHNALATGLPQNNGSCYSLVLPPAGR